MPYGPFELEITNEATKLDFDNLSEEVRTHICQEAKYDPQTHDIFSFSVAPRESLGFSYGLTRQQKKKSYAKVDRVLVQAAPKHESITFLGIHPTTTSVSGQNDLDLKGDILFELAIPKILKCQVKSQIKNKIRSDVYEIFSTRTNGFAQWIFLKNWVKSGGPFNMRILCSVPKQLGHEERVVTCDAEAQQKGRKINGIYRKTVRLA
ncbi:hypothetical protein [Halorhodospira sp. 9622]|uniref:hypothetical protein n=1 Tax=Halorhodospira sp. 9622 TaxID=2899136 RepID=UPI001EE7A82C|nr:hypothetical protein [Halorhodospira sp. 9622]MCG5537375.1 hypothetical protein [Halorhodospira sp. 9622]